MKLLFIYVFFLCFVTAANAQLNCNRAFSPSLNISWGLDANTQPYGTLEAGIWGNNAPLGVYGGVKIISHKNELKSDEMYAPDYSPVIIPTVTVTGKITTREDYTFIHSPFVTAGGKGYYGGGYRLHYLLGGVVMVGAEVSYNTITHTNAGIIFIAAF